MAKEQLVTYQFRPAVRPDWRLTVIRVWSVVILILLAPATTGLDCDYLAQLYMRAVQAWGYSPHATIDMADIGDCSSPGAIAGVNFPPLTPASYIQAPGHLMYTASEKRTTILINGNCNWMGGAAQRKAAFEVVLHEVGHTFYPIDHSFNHSSIMWPYCNDAIINTAHHKKPRDMRITDFDRALVTMHQTSVPFYAAPLPEYVFGNRLRPPRWLVSLRPTSTYYVDARLLLKN